LPVTVLIIPLALQETAKRIFRALDPDTGGYESFATVTDTEATYSTPMDNVELLESADLLYAFVRDDYAARWAEFECPTLTDCQQFITGVTING
jgi:hypothetical protein